MLSPWGSMYGIFTYIYHKNQANVGKYTIHGSDGSDWIPLVPSASWGFCYVNSLQTHPARPLRGTGSGGCRGPHPGRWGCQFFWVPKFKFPVGEKKKTRETKQTLPQMLLSIYVIPNMNTCLHHTVRCIFFLCGGFVGKLRTRSGWNFGLDFQIALMLMGIRNFPCNHWDRLPTSTGAQWNYRCGSFAQKRWKKIHPGRR